ncbi:aldo/keto reductase [Nonomuraea jiangxiensis]|uniref:NDP-hexose 2,3-enoyl reductase n=1 Tax=Nonomuraea jiangxiensis TaxID=633440 RepID=A0A1G8RXQ9_9ACTN|nr:aldo/keto reductase [Nonomuraea jiangxiensis]SDJ21702.1 NDP-hexose 2,3-enoyl reductase [Nonomuraea jiangxiensis]
METRLGRTALTVSRFCLGTVNFGGRTDEDEGHRIMDSALEHGITFFDTADMYGWRVHKGYTEETIGRWLSKGAGRRDEVVLATKVGNQMGAGRNDGGLSARHIVAACEGSLRRLNTDWIDLYQLHQMDLTAPWEEVWQAMSLLISQGKVRYVGSSNFAGWHLSAGQHAAERLGLLGLVSEQCLYNLATRHAELEVIPAAQAYRLAVLPWAPLHSGLLGGVLGKLRTGQAVKSAQGRAVPALERHREATAGYEALCAELGHPPAQVGLAWLLSRPGVTAPVIGPRTVAQLESLLPALDLTLGAAELARLDELFPPVAAGGPGPKAWIE